MGIGVNGHDAGIVIAGQETSGDVHVILLRLPSGKLVKVTVVGVEASAVVLNAR